MTSGGLAAVSSSAFAALYSAFGKYDVVHIHAEGPAFFAWLPKMFGKRVVVTVHGECGAAVPQAPVLTALASSAGLSITAAMDGTSGAQRPTVCAGNAAIPFTIAGNGEVEDDIVDDPSKEFFTVKTKGGNTFFLVIDRARNSENVYMLSMIDEYDLQEFLDDEERNGKQEEETPAVVLPETKPEPTPDVEIEEPKEESSGGMNKILLLVFVAALGGAGAFFYFYIYKPKPKEETPQSENLETDQSLATVNEDNQSGNENGT